MCVRASKGTKSLSETLPGRVALSGRFPGIFCILSVRGQTGSRTTTPLALFPAIGRMQKTKHMV